MRIIAGEWRGRQLQSPTWDGLRPTSDRLRETLFNVLGPSIRGARVLDGYAGTGAVGIEALSRGAAHVTFVERDPRAVEADRGEPRCAGRDGCYHPRRIRGRGDAAGGQVFDLIILDPPYGNTAAADALDAAHVARRGRTLVVVEHATRHAPPAERAGLRLTRTVKAGDSALSFYEHA